MKFLIAFLSFFLICFSLHAQHRFYLGAELCIPSNFSEDTYPGKGLAMEYEYTLTGKSGLHITAAYDYFTGHNNRKFRHSPFRIGYVHHFGKVIYAYADAGMSNDKIFDVNTNNLGASVGSGAGCAISFSPHSKLQASLNFNYAKFPQPGYYYTWFTIRASYGFQFGKR